MNKIMEFFWGAVVVAAVLLYGSMSLTDLDERYEAKVLASTFSVFGEHRNLLDMKDSPDADLATYEKAVLVNYAEMYPSMGRSLRASDAESKRFIATAYAETDLRYHLKFTPGTWAPTTLDFSTNLLYNVSYILNTPVKLAHNLKTDFQWHGDYVRPYERWIFAGWDVLHAISGIGIAMLMMFLGSIIGLVSHPTYSFTNFFPSLWQVVLTVWHAISNFIYLAKSR